MAVAVGVGVEVAVDVAVGVAVAVGVRVGMGVRVRVTVEVALWVGGTAVASATKLEEVVSARSQAVIRMSQRSRKAIL